MNDISNINVKRDRQVLTPNLSRVMARLTPCSPKVIKRVIDYVLSISDAQCKALCDNVMARFMHRHRDYEQILLDNYQRSMLIVEQQYVFNKNQTLLLGAYFTYEYSIESASLCNPSIVPHPDQSAITTGSLRFVMSLRAIGEGHISSIVFRTGVIDNNNKITFESRSQYANQPSFENDMVCDKSLLLYYLREQQFPVEIMSYLDKLPEIFNKQQLKQQLQQIIVEKPSASIVEELIEAAEHFVNSQYIRLRKSDQDLSECVIFPEIDSFDYEDIRNGIEDARFVQFTDEDGEQCYYATYTAYDGRDILPKLLYTKDFISFRMIAFQGKATQDKATQGKGMALFPRKVNGQYAMLSRQGESNRIMFSDNLHVWDKASSLNKPENYWELIRIGNCGSPIETSAGWLVITHGKGLMGEYSVGAMLLDLDDPIKVIGHLNEPLLTVNEEEREGYMPSVIYSCGSLLKGDTLVLAYGISDHRTSIATVKLAEVLAAMN